MIWRIRDAAICLTHSLATSDASGQTHQSDPEPTTYAPFKHFKPQVRRGQMTQSDRLFSTPGQIAKSDPN